MDSVTVVDLIRGGCCESGVWAVVRAKFDKIAAAMPTSAVLRLTPLGDRQTVLNALRLDGSGSGSGYGSGSGGDE